MSEKKTPNFEKSLRLKLKHSPVAVEQNREKFLPEARVSTSFLTDWYLHPASSDCFQRQCPKARSIFNQKDEILMNHLIGTAS